MRARLLAFLVAGALIAAAFFIRGAVTGDKTPSFGTTPGSTATTAPPKGGVAIVCAPETEALCNQVVTVAKQGTVTVLAPAAAAAAIAAHSLDAAVWLAP